MSISRDREAVGLTASAELPPVATEFAGLAQVGRATGRAHMPGVSRMLRRIDRRHTPYSFVSAAAGFLLFLTLIVDLIFSNNTGNPIELDVLLLVASAACTVVPLVMGRRYPPWAGLIPVSVLALSALYFIGFSDIDQRVVSSMQELPIVALYLGWFYRGWLARSIIIVFSICVFIAILLSSSFGESGHFSLPFGVASVAIMAFCFEAGSYLQRELERHAVHDHLTGVLNRRGFSERFALEQDRSRRMGAKLTLAVIDFDHFKRVNDEQGHAAGDELLRSSVRAWSMRLFDSDALGRLGGDEFVMLLPQRSLRDSRALLELLRRASTHSWSWGLSEVGPDDTLECVLSRADAELYERKAKVHQ